MDQEQVNSILKQHGDWVRKLEGVLAVGCGEDPQLGICVLVFTNSQGGFTEKTKAQIVERLSDFPISFKDSPKFEIQ